ncbi:MAG: hypothetical protein NZM11_10870, partial [Anaerolineales bacterium]|nr:hypothetical protein [Anaerolineales bacterium]
MLRTASLNLFIARLIASVVVVGTVFVSLGVAAAALFDLAYRGRIYPGVQAWGIDLSGLRPEEAALALTAAFTYPQNDAFILADGSIRRTVRPADLGVTFDVGATVLAAYNIGRSGDLLADWRAQYAAWHD